MGSTAVMNPIRSADLEGWPRGSTERALAASPKIFLNPFLDRLSRVHHLVPLALYSPVAALLLWMGLSSLPVSFVCVGFLGGYLIWTLIEYLGHRILFHFVPKTPAGKRLQFLMHGVHHDYPADPLRLVMPPLMSLPIMAAAYVVLRVVWDAQHVLPIFAGFVAGYVIYDMLHFHIHHRRPATRLGRWLRYRHMHHHFRDSSSWYGVSAPWWDAIFATRPRQLERDGSSV